MVLKQIEDISNKESSKKVNSKEETSEDNETTGYINIMDLYDELPEYEPGGIYDLVNKFEWITKPSEKDYDPNNKVANKGCYGYTTAESNMRGEISKEIYFYDKENSLLDELKGEFVYNKANVYNIGDEFELKAESLNGFISNVEVVEDISKLNETYFFDLEEVKKELDNNKVLVTLDINLHSYGNWITESDIVPVLMYLSDNGEYLKVIEDGVNEEIRPVYYDLGFYDFTDTEECFLYPMRNDEKVEFKVGYIIDENKVDNAYLYYKSYGSDDIENSYNKIYDVLVKLK